MFFRSNKPRRKDWWEELDEQYPPGSEWVYLGRPVIVLRTHFWSGFPYRDPQIQYVDDRGVIQTSPVCLSELRPRTAP